MQRPGPPMSHYQSTCLLEAKPLPLHHVTHFEHLKHNTPLQYNSHTRMLRYTKTQSYMQCGTVLINSSKGA